MLVFWKQKLVVLAVPKTGTTALEAALEPHASAAILDPPGMKHVSLSRYRSVLEGFFEQRGRAPHEVMAIMREPIDWLGSWYRYRSRDQLKGKPNSTQGIDFDRFIEAWLEDKPPSFAQVGSQAKFLTPEAGQAEIDHLFRYDQMEEAVGFLEGRLGKSLNLPRKNVSPDFELVLSPEMETRLRRERAAEFDLWNRLCAKG